MIKPLLATTLFFFSLFIFPAFAYLPVLNNISSGIPSTVGNIEGIMCPNATYCYVLAGTAGATSTRIYRYNATLGGAAFCSLSTLGTSTTYGAAMFNATTMRVTFSTASMDFDVGALGGGTCANTTTLYSGIGFTGSEQGAWYDSVTDWWYYPGRIVNSTGGVQMSNYNLEALNAWFVLPNKTDNATAYDGSRFISSINKYTNGAFEKEIADPNTLWGISTADDGADYYFMDLIKINASTTFGYIILRKDASNIELLRVNFTAADTVGSGTTITAIYPINNLTISQAMNPTVALNANLTTGNNGTITWYLDGLFLGNTSVTANVTNGQYYFSTGILTAGQHYWNATFYDIYNNAWKSSNSTFFMSPTSAITTVGQSLANALGVDLDYGKMMLALLISAALSGALAYYVKWQLFLPSMIVCIFFFAVAGFFPVWFTLIFVVIGGILFAKFSGLVG